MNTMSRDKSRGQSEVLGFVLILGITMIGLTTIIIFGGNALKDAQQQAQIEQAEQSFGVLDGRISRVALGASPVQTVDLGLNTGSSGATLKSRDTGWIRVTYVNTSTGSRSVVMNRTLGAIIYANDDTTLAYQGGGVWRHTDGGTIMVSPPEFHYHDGTLTFPLVTVTGGGPLTSSITVTQEGTQIQKYPNRNQQTNFTNPIPRDVKVKVTVDSTFYQGWGVYFEERTDGQVEFDHAKEQATIELTDPISKVGSALTLVGGSQLQIQDQAVLSSYDSSAASPTFGGTDGDIVSDSSVQIQNNVRIKGNITVGGQADISGMGNAGRIHGYLSYGAGSVSQSACDDHVDGACTKNASLGDKRSIDTRISNRIARIEESNNNEANPHITNGELNWTGTDNITLEAGDYYFNQSFQVQGSNSAPQNLTLDTTNGDIAIAVKDTNIQIQNHGNITVKGDGAVRFYNDKQIQIQGQSDVWVPGYDSPQLWMYCTSNCGIQLNSGSPRFVGVMYAPEAANGVQVQDHAEVYGGIVGGGQVQIQDDAHLHYDEVLSTTAVFPDRAPVIYMHVSVYRMTIKSE
ncbi:DUF7289 family protein [Halorussus sp. AFM4]|uniref:DUF7289 family protein n=1 Tax=Halorussus sp. AFM4 TaxID=3421651 RepID=UPI003EB935FA